MTSSFMFIGLLNLRCASGRSFAGYPAESGSGGAPFAETPNGLGARENCLISSVESEVENPVVRLAVVRHRYPGCGARARARPECWQRVIRSARLGRRCPGGALRPAPPRIRLRRNE